MSPRKMKFKIRPAYAPNPPAVIPRLRSLFYHYRPQSRLTRALFKQKRLVFTSLKMNLYAFYVYISGFYA